MQRPRTAEVNAWKAARAGPHSDDFDSDLALILLITCRHTLPHDPILYFQNLLVLESHGKLINYKVSRKQAVLCILE